MACSNFVVGFNKDFIFAKSSLPIWAEPTIAMIKSLVVDTIYLECYSSHNLDTSYVSWTI